MCSECLRPRLLHASYKLSWLDKQAVASTVKEVLYSCGASFKQIIPEGVDPELVSRVFAKNNLSCSMPVEIPCYFSGAFEDICIHCACNSKQAELLSPDGAYPVCKYCNEVGNEKTL